MNTSKLQHTTVSASSCMTTAYFQNSLKARGMVYRLITCFFLFFAFAVESPRAQVFGDGSDGNSTITGSVSLTSNKNFNNLTILSGAVLTTNGFDVRVNGTLLINFGTLRSGYLNNLGLGGGGGNGGFGFGGHVPPQDGQPGQPGAAVGGGNGDGGDGGGGGGGGGGAWDPARGKAVSGGKGGAGGNGGNGARALNVYARNLQSSGGINADGQDGSNGVNGSKGFFDSYLEGFFPRDHAGGGGGGGGHGEGGGGGDVTIVYQNLVALGSVSSTGGAGGGGAPGAFGLNTFRSAGPNQREENGRTGGFSANGGNGGNGGRSERDGGASQGGTNGLSGANGASGVVKTIASITCYADTDGDGFGDPGSPAEFVSCPAGYSTDNTDCDDTDASINPGAAEITCDGIDNDCNPATLDEPDSDGDGFSVCVDCDDGNASVFPGATEVCNNIDDNCDTFVDEGVTNTYYEDADGDGFGNSAVTTQACSQPSGFVTDDTDCDDTDINVFPGATEICNGVDDDCDGNIDEGVTNTYYEDSDGDGFGNSAVTTQACSPPAGFVSDSTDNCPSDFNPTQADADSNGVGDACCCIGTRGDLNGDGNDANILDLTFMVDYIFRGSGNGGGCPNESDVNGDGDPANILDLTFLVDYIFRGGGPTGPC